MILGTICSSEVLVGNKNSRSSFTSTHLANEPVFWKNFFYFIFPPLSGPSPNLNRYFSKSAVWLLWSNFPCRAQSPQSGLMGSNEMPNSGTPSSRLGWQNCPPRLVASPTYHFFVISFDRSPRWILQFGNPFFFCHDVRSFYHFLWHGLKGVMTTDNKLDTDLREAPNPFHPLFLF